MQRFHCSALVTIVVAAMAGQARAADDAAKTVVDKAIAALGGEAKLNKAKAITWKSKGKINLGGDLRDFTSQATFAGLDRYRLEFEGEFEGNPVKGVTLINGDKGSRTFDQTVMDFDVGSLANEKRNVYLQVVPVALVPLKGNEFQLEMAGEETVAGADAVGIKVTAPDGKEFKLYFDKTSGLPVKLVARVVGLGGEVTQVTTYANYKDFKGVKKATKIEAKRDGQDFLTAEITDFELLDQVDPKLFEEPK
jgi:hypothetical protein